MSTNLHIQAVREIIVVKTGVKTTQTQSISVWQTPTSVTFELIKAVDPLEAYFEWVRSVSRDEEEEIFDLDDELIGTVIVNRGELHITDLKDHIEELTRDGFDIQLEAW